MAAPDHPTPLSNPAIVQSRRTPPTFLRCSPCSSSQSYSCVSPMMTRSGFVGLFRPVRYSYIEDVAPVYTAQTHVVNACDRWRNLSEVAARWLGGPHEVAALHHGANEIHRLRRWPIATALWKVVLQPPHDDAKRLHGVRLRPHE